MRRLAELAALAALVVTPSVFALDLTPPVLTLPSPITAEATGQLTSLNYTAIAVDAVDGPVAIVCIPPFNSLFPLGTSLVVCTAVDLSGNIATGSFTVTMRDTTGPIITTPPNLTTGASSAAGSTFNYVASATDAVDGPVPVVCLPPSGSFFTFGTTTVRCSASDAAGNSRTRNFNVTITDTFPPVLTLPSSVRVAATSATGANVTYAATAIDALDGAVPVVCQPPSGSRFGIGFTTVTCRAQDTRGNEAVGSFTVEVTPFDTTAPVLALPHGLNASATSSAGAAVTYAATATDNVDGTVPVTCNVSSGSTFAIGTTTVTCTAKDALGNQSSGTFTVTVADVQPPSVLSATASPNTIWPPNHKWVPVRLSVVAIDPSDPNVTAYIVEIRSSDDIKGSGHTVGPDARITGPLTGEVRAERSGSLASRTYTFVVEVADSSGNATRREITVRVAHDK
jgi:hypothetical protein